MNSILLIIYFPTKNNDCSEKLKSLYFILQIFIYYSYIIFYFVKIYILTNYPLVKLKVLE